MRLCTSVLFDRLRTARDRGAAVPGLASSASLA
jgi:hypothetical protein